MSEEHILKKFKTMNVASIKSYLKERGVIVNGYLKPALVTIAAAVEKIMLPLDPNYMKGITMKKTYVNAYLFMICKSRILSQ